MWRDSDEDIIIYTPEELETYLIEAGFKNIEIFRSDKDCNVAVIARK